MCPSGQRLGPNQTGILRLPQTISSRNSNVTTGRVGCQLSASQLREGHPDPRPPLPSPSVKTTVTCEQVLLFPRTGAEWAGLARCQPGLLITAAIPEKQGLGSPAGQETGGRGGDSLLHTPPTQLPSAASRSTKLSPPEDSHGSFPKTSEVRRVPVPLKGLRTVSVHTLGQGRATLSGRSSAPSSEAGLPVTHCDSADSVGPLVVNGNPPGDLGVPGRRGHRGSALGSTACLPSTE